MTFNCGGPATITFAGAYTIAQDTTINGGDVITLSGGDTARLFIVNSGATLRLQHLVLDAAVNVGSDEGAIANHGNLWLENSTIQNSYTDNDHSGGAIFSDGPVTITNSLLQNNQGGNGGGALYANSSQALVTISNSTFRGNQAVNTTTGLGGAIFVGNQAQLSLTGGAILSNSAQSGGGVYIFAGPAVLANATLSGNSALVGGALYNNLGTLTAVNVTLNANHAASDDGAIASDGPLAVINSTLSGNTAQASAGAISSAAILTLTDSSLISNSAGLNGGGLLISGTATLSNVTLSGNSSTSSVGGGIDNFTGPLTLVHATLSGNSAQLGGGIYNAGTLALTDSTLSGNAAQASGGGLYNTTSARATTVTNSTLSGNSAATYGGGIFSAGTALFNGTTLTVTNSTLSGNSAASGGGGIENDDNTAVLSNVTLSGNSASLGGGGIEEQSSNLSQTITLKNTIVAFGLSGANCYVNPPGGLATIISNGYNLSNDGTCASYLKQTGDLNGENPNLGPLANYGGPTLTHRPNPPSKAINAIPLGVNGCGTTLTTDQRGAPRPINGKCDMGAVEYGWLYQHLWLALIRR